MTAERRCLCGAVLPADDHPEFTLWEFPVVNCPHAPPRDVWLFDPRYVRSIPIR